MRKRETNLRVRLRVIAPPDNTALFEEMWQRWRAGGSSVTDLTGPRFEPHTSRSRDERVTARSVTKYS